MSEQHFALNSRPTWDANRDQQYLDCACGKRVWGDTREEATEEFKVHQEDQA